MADPLGSTSFREALMTLVRRRVPARDAEDVVQTVLVEALRAERRPDEPEALRKWIWGLCRHKIADYHRRAGRETVADTEAGVAPDAVDDLLRWAMRELPDTQDAQKTLSWLLREAEGESLEEIAAAERVPPAAVRQRVSRLRKVFRARWAVQLAAVGLLAGLLWLWLRRPHERPSTQVPHALPAPEQELVAILERARALRAEGLAACTATQWTRCVQKLDEARALDPNGDRDPAVQQARQRAHDALVPERAPAPAPPAERPRPETVPTGMFGTTGDSTGLGSTGSSEFDSLSATTSAPRRRTRRASVSDGGA